MYDDELLGDLRARHPRADISGVGVGADAEGGGVIVAVRCARPGILIGKGAKTLAELKSHLQSLPRFVDVDVAVHIVEVRRMELDALLLAAHVINNLARGVDVARTVERAAQSAVRAGALACRVDVEGAVASSSSAGAALSPAEAPPAGAHAKEVDVALGDGAGRLFCAAVAGVRRVVDTSAWRPTDDEPDDESGDEPPEPVYVDVGAVTCTVALVVAPTTR